MASTRAAITVITTEADRDQRQDRDGAVERHARDPQDRQPQRRGAESDQRGQLLAVAVYQPPGHWRGCADQQRHEHAAVTRLHATANRRSRGSTIYDDS